MAAAAAAASTPAAILFLLLPTPLLRNAILLLLPALLRTAAGQSALLSTPPFAVNATNTAITFKAETQCPPNCGVSYITWQIKGSNNSWTPGRKEYVEKPYTFDGLQPGMRYEVRALLDMGGKPYMGEDVPVATAYTCSHKVPKVENLTEAEVGTDFVQLRWNPPGQMCASVHYYFQLGLYRKTYGRLSEKCPPDDLVSPEPNYTCRAAPQVEGGWECSVRIGGLDAGDKYAFGVIGVDWTGRCSSIAFEYTVTKRGPSPFGLSIGAWSCILLVIIIISVSSPCLYSYWKRKTGRSLFGEDENVA